MRRQTVTAIMRRLHNGETRFFIGNYYYEFGENGLARRREQRPGYTATTDWERIGSWNPYTGNVEFAR